MVRKIIFGILLLFMSATGFASDFPALRGQVVDEAGILSLKTKAHLAGIIRSDQQFVVVTLKSLRGQTIEQYGLALGNHWGIGRFEKNDGLLFIVAPNERAVRIEVGDGLSAVISDAKAKEIIEKVILPEFKKGDYNAGVIKGVQVLQAVLSGQSVNIQPQDSMESVFKGAFMLFCAHGFALLFLFKIYAAINKRIEKYRNRPEVYTWRLLSFLTVCVMCLQIAVAGLIIYSQLQGHQFLSVQGVCSALSLFVYMVIYSFMGIGPSFRSRLPHALFPDHEEERDSWFSSRRRSSSRDSFRGGGGSFGGGGASGHW